MSFTSSAKESQQSVSNRMCNLLNVIHVSMVCQLLVTDIAGETAVRQNFVIN